MRPVNIQNSQLETWETGKIVKGRKVRRRADSACDDSRACSRRSLLQVPAQTSPDQKSANILSSLHILRRLTLHQDSKSMRHSDNGPEGFQ